MKKNNEDKREPTQNNEKKSELRSPKVRTLLDGMPKSLTSVGFITITIILVALICAVTLIPYPYSNGESILEHLLNNV